MIQTEELASHNAIRHGFLGLEGGVSEGAYATLNCGYGSGDEVGRVSENRRRALDSLGAPAAALVSLHQEHMATAIHVTEPWEQGAAPTTDAMATKVPGIALGVLTADCAPVLMADASAGVMGAAHAGWRGALEGVTDALIDLMVELGASPANIAAAIGPCIAQDSYETGPEFRKRFVAADGANGDLFRPGQRLGHAMFDLAGYLERRLAAKSIGRVAVAGIDTYPDDSGFYSYRRSRHRGENQYGRALSVITLAADSAQ